MKWTIVVMFAALGLLCFWPLSYGSTIAAPTCAPLVQWTRFTGVVKALNLRDSTVTLELKGGEIVTVPVDYQVKIKTKSDDVVRQLKDLDLDEKIVVTHVPSAEPPKDETFQEMNAGESKLK